MSDESRQMKAFVVNAGHVCYVVTAESVVQARSVIRKLRGDGKIGVRQIDLSKSQIWGLFQIGQVSIDGEGIRDIDAVVPVDCSDANR